MAGPQPRYFLMRAAEARVLSRSQKDARWPVGLGALDRLNAAFAEGERLVSSVCLCMESCDVCSHAAPVESHACTTRQRCLVVPAVIEIEGRPPERRPGWTGAASHPQAAPTPLHDAASPPRRPAPAGGPVTLIFTVTGSGAFQGCARMLSEATQREVGTVPGLARLAGPQPRRCRWRAAQRCRRRARVPSCGCTAWRVADPPASALPAAPPPCRCPGRRPQLLPGGVGAAGGAPVWRRGAPHVRALRGTWRGGAWCRAAGRRRRRCCHAAALAPEALCCR